MDTVATRRQSFQAGAIRAGHFWLTYVQSCQRAPASLDAEQDNILQAIAVCQAHKAAWPVAANLAWHLHPHMIYTGLWRLWEHRLVCMLKASNQAGGGMTRALLQQSLAEVQGRQGRWQEATWQAEQAVALLREVADPHHLARGLRDLAHWVFCLGRWEEVEALAEEAQALTGPEGDRGVLADACILRGRICLEQGRADEAVCHFESALQVADEPRQKAATNFLGQAHLKQERPNRALPCFHKALEIAEREGDRPGQGVILNNVGATCLKLGRLDLALLYLERGLAITRETDNLAVEARILLKLGQVHLALEQKRQALCYFDQALRVARKIGNLAWEAEILQAFALADAYAGSR